MLCYNYMANFVSMRNIGSNLRMFHNAGEKKICSRMLAGQQSSIAQHTKDTVQIWRDCASLRIIIQSALQMVHQPSFESESQSDSSSDYVAVLGSLLQTAANRVESTTHSKTSNAAADASWEFLEAQNRAVMAYCLAEADKWHESTKLPNRKNLKALDQSISSQMQYVMSDPDERAVKRCRGSNPDEYDDAPLYAALLKESVQKGASGDEYRAMKMASKFGKRPQAVQVDRRASKGRKIRYSSIERLVNFMAPRPVPLSEGIPITDEQLINAYVNSIFQ